MVGVALVVVLEVVADHEGLAAAALLALVRPLVGVRPHVLLQVGPGREGLAAAALGNVAVERVAYNEKPANWSLLRPKINCGVGLVNCFFRVSLMYQPCCLLPCCQSKLGELAKKQFTKPTPQFILGRSITWRK